MLTSDDFGAAFGPNQGDVEILTLNEGEEAPKDEPIVEQGPTPVQMTQEEYAKLLQGQNSTEAMAKGLENLAAKLGGQQPVNAPVVDDFDPAKLEQEMYTPGKAVETIGKVAQRIATQQTAQMAMGMQLQEKRLLKIDPETAETYKMFEKDIEERVKSLPPQYRYAPNVYQQVYQQVMQERQGDVINLKAQEMAKGIAEKAVAEALAAAGIKTAPKGQGAVYSEGGAPSVPRAQPKERLVMTSQDKRDMLESMMDPTDPDQVRAFLNAKSRKGGR
jgi:hypothetical protein